MIVNNSTEYHKIKSYIRHLKRNNTNEEKLIQSFYQELNTEDRQFFDNIDKDNAEALKLLKTLLSERDQWSYVATNKDVTVARRYLSAGPFVSHLDAEKGDKHACVKSSAVLNASAADIFNLFLDTDLATEYNEHIASVSDLYSPHISSKTTSWTKISYTTGPSLGIFKARDFCSVVNYIISPDKSSYIILNRPAYFSQAKPNSKYTRATIMLAGNIITSLGPDKAEVTLVAHVNPGGAGDTMAAAFFINQLCAMGPPTFIRRLEAAAKNMHHTKPPLSSAKARYVKMK